MNTSVAKLSNAELVKSLKLLVAKERETTREILVHLAELDRRRLYAELGYSSLYDYCVRGLGYSESGAMRRIKAALGRLPTQESMSYQTSGCPLI